MTGRLTQRLGALSLLVGFLCHTPQLSPAEFIRGDTDANGQSDLSDAVRVLLFLFAGNSLHCEDAADADDSGVIDISDGIYVLQFLFLDGPRPPEPFENCGEDPTPDLLGCASFPPCPDDFPQRVAPEPNLGPGSQEPVFDSSDADAVSLYPPDGSTVLNTGEERLTRTDLEIPGRGQIDFAMTRRYRSRLNYNGPLGHGWDFSYNEALYEQANGDIVRSNGLGHVDRWVRTPGGSYVAPAGFFATLIREPDGSFIYREADGFKRFFDVNGRLRSHEDRFGNRMAFQYDTQGNLGRVVDPYGREIDFVFQTQADGVERLVRIVDFTGREVHYAYDARGDLSGVISPVVTGTSTGNDFPQGRTERYTYSSGFASSALNHNLLTVTRPEEVAKGGPPSVVCTYGADPAEGASFDRILSKTEGGTNASGIPAGGTTTYSYQTLNGAAPLGNLHLPRLQITVTERNGNVFQFFGNEMKHQIRRRRLTRGLRPGEPAYFETNFEYTADGLATRIVFPAGNATVYTYDTTGPRAAQRNVLEVRRVADATRGGGEDLVTTMAYEPLFNQLSLETDPRGNATGFLPPIGTASASRYTTRYFYDYQEGSAPIPDALKFGIDLSGIRRGLGDLNDDGATDQLAGNRVRTEAPSVLLLSSSNEARRVGGTSQAIVTETQWNDRGQKTATIDPEGNLTTYRYYPENDPDGDGRVVPGEASTAARGYLKTWTRDALPAPGRRTARTAPAELETRLGYDPVGNVVSRRDPRGIGTAYEVNQLNEVVQRTRGANIDRAVATDQLITGEDAFGYRSRSHYDFNGRLVLSETENRASVSTTAGVGDWVARSFTYDILDNVVETTHEVDGTTSVVTRRRYDANELPTQRIKPEGNVVKVDYDERNLPFKVHKGFGAPEVSVVQFDYDLNANLARQFDSEDNDGDGNPEERTYVYDGFDRRTITTDPLGNQTVSSYDVASNVVRIETMGHRPDQPLAGNVLLADRFFSYDELNRRYQVDEALFLASGFDPLRTEDLRDDNSDGLVTRITEYDALSRRTFLVDDDTDVSQMVYDGASRVVERIDALGNRIRRSYDKNSNLIELQSIEVSPDGIVPDEIFTTHYVYDQLNRRVRTTDNVGRTRRFAFDSRDNVTLLSDGVGATLESDPLGVFAGSINGPGNTTTLYYDGRDLRIREVSDLRAGGQGEGDLDMSNAFNPDGQVTVEFIYDGNSRLSELVDDNGNVTRYTYDALDRRISQTNADGTQLTFDYDRDGNQIMVVDPNGSVITNTFDALNRLVGRSVTPAPGVIGTTAETYSYDGVSRLTSSSDNNGSGPSHNIVRIYDSLSRILEEQEDGEPHSSVYSGDGNRLELDYPTSRIIQFEYDATDRMKRVIDPFPTPLPVAGAGVGGVVTNQTVVEYSWIGGGDCSCHCPCESRPLSLAFGNGTQASFLNSAGDIDVGYDGVREVVALRHLVEGSPFVDRTYTYNNAYMRTSEELLDIQGSPVNTYTLDSTYRVTRAFLAADGSAEGFSTRIDYTLDGVGNRRRVDFSQDFGGGVTADFTDNYLANEVNEYDEAGGGGGPREHDSNGNLTSGGGFDYAYDYRNRLVEVRRKSDQMLRAHYEYDTENRRVRKLVFDLANPGRVESEIRYFHDGPNVIEEWSDEADYDLNGPIATYVYGVGIDQPVQMETSVSASAGAGRFYYHQDARNNVVAMTNASAVLVEKTRYDDFGNFTQEKSIGNPYLFQGRRYDGETGLFYYRNRYYDPLAGRFIQRDPVWDPNNVGNQYTFVGNRPTSHLDPYGLNVGGVGIDVMGWWGPVGLQFSVDLVVDSTGDIGLVGAISYLGGGGAGGGVTAGPSISNAPTISDLDGESVGVFGASSVGPIPVMISADADAVLTDPPNPTGDVVKDFFQRKVSAAAGGLRVGLGEGVGGGVKCTKTGTVKLPKALRPVLEVASPIFGAFSLAQRLGLF